MLHHQPLLLHQLPCCIFNPTVPSTTHAKPSTTTGPPTNHAAPPTTTGPSTTHASPLN
ncbi:hypothetical protein DDB_G0290741 [Dictyostelium discoideum AX4]|uniref:hypothetical protein n=1 Tax=Dictyostelium discoideum AX4 TaxID=352472 RepID=UPI00004E5006|nr:hypothetical protein DDB_G0290741 [Dictyostelium discoideum AX4]EAL62076.1 hypothetical protein DDB_G0290741 [Dictyostelium discoideum AX4]|eukprot:XP_635582.1 hypothetical protein DDB_G0290741 [Dictyostelium discoideum AX4]